MRAAQLSRPGGPLEIVNLEIPQPGPGQIRLRVDACGICHGDALALAGRWPGFQYPRTPGHEVAGVIDAIGDGVERWKVGQRAGVGWHGGHCTHCLPCRRGTFNRCEQLKVPGLVYDGGYSEYMITPAQGLAAIPDTLTSQEAAPLLCAGLTTFNSLRRTGALAGDLVAVQGLGGLGHLGVQFASKMGFETVAVGRGRDKEQEMRAFGAHHYIDAEAEKPAEALQKLGGAKTILATGFDSKAMAALVDGLGVDGTLITIGADMNPMEVSPLQLISKTRSMRGWSSGVSADSEDTLRFCAITGVRPRIETFPLAQAPAAFGRMMSGKARYRVVLTMR